MVVRIPSVEALFGRALVESSAEAIARVALAGQRELPQLDWKRSLYAHANDGKDELAKDICAFANHLGGAIVLGVEDGSKGAAPAAPGVEVDDDELLWMRSVVAAWVSPFPAYDLLIAPIAGTTRAFLVVLVPPSPAAPHAVVRPGQERLLYPVRDGTKTRYLAEAELANAYRRRFLGLDDRRRRLDEITEEALRQMAGGELLLSVSLVPLVPGYGAVSFAETRAVDDWVRDYTHREALGGEHSLSGIRAEPGLDRFVLGYRDSGLTDEEGRARWGCGQLHTDGSGAVVRHVLTPEEGKEGTLPGVFDLVDTALVEKAVDLLGLLVDFAVRVTGAGGLAECRLVLATNGDHPRRVVRLGDAKTGFMFRSLGRRQLPLPISIDRTLDLTAMSERVRGLLVGARLLAQGVVQASGYAELRQIDGEGRIRMPYVGARGEAVRFAGLHGIEVVEESMG